ncbi:MAG: hypothetical protein MRJ68_07905 [Nitrospira sp.]|nr:hypothetical protein [Nitrospira sp.]
MNVDSLLQNSYRFRRKLAGLGPHLFSFAVLIGGLVNAQSSIGGESYGYPVSREKVSIEKKTASKDWSILESQTVKFEPVHDKVKITEDGFDFGGDTLVAGAPTNSADVTWVWKEGKVTPSGHRSAAHQ